MKITVNDWFSGCYDVFDSNNKRISFVQWADSRSGYYEFLVMDDKEEFLFNEKTQSFLSKVKKENIVIRRKDSYWTIFKNLLKHIGIDIKTFFLLLKKENREELT